MTNDEIDKLVATKVRGWSEDEFKVYCKYFKPSTDIGIAFECVEAHHKNTGQWTLVSKYNDNKYVAYEATGCADPDFGDYFAYGETPSLAICKALLKAVGIEIN